MARIGLHGLKCLLYAIALLALVPCVTEFALRIAAVQEQANAVSTPALVTVVPSATMHHQMAPLQRRRLESDSSSAEATFQTNSLGLRGEEIVVPKPLSTFRIVCLGDESWLASRLPETDTFAPKLKAHLQPFTTAHVEVINAALPDACPLLAFLQAKHQLLALNPDVWIVHVDPTDVIDDTKFRRWTELDPAETPLVCTHPALMTQPKIQPLCEHFLCLKWLKSCATECLASGSDDESSAAFELSSSHPAYQDPQRLSHVVRPIAQLARLVESSGGRVMCVVHPRLQELVASGDSAAADSGAQDRITAWRVIEELEVTGHVPVCRIQSTLKRVTDPAAAIEKDHRGLTAFGHDVYAYAMAETLLKSIPGPWNVGPRSTSEIQPTASRTRE